MAGVRLSGWANTARKYVALGAALDASRQEKRYVGTVVWYAHFPEFGTSRQSARPYLRPAVKEAAARWNSGTVIRRKKKSGESILRAPGENLLDPIAEAVRDSAKSNVRKKGLILTEDLHDSIEIGKSVEDLSRRSKARVKNPENV